MPALRSTSGRVAAWLALLMLAVLTAAGSTSAGSVAELSTRWLTFDLREARVLG